MKYLYNELHTSLTIDKVFTIHYFNYAKDFRYPGEIHNFWEFVYVDSGEVIVTDHDKTITLKQGEIICHEPNIFHNITANKIFSNIVIFTFKCTSPFIRALAHKTFVLNEREKFLLKIIIEEGALCFTEPQNLVELTRMTLSASAPFASEQQIKCALEMLTISLIRDTQILTSEKLAHTTRQKIVSDINQLLREKLDKKITLQHLSEILGYSKTYIKVLYKKQTGLTIMNSLTNIRIEEAKKLIAENTLSFTEIADLLGYDSAAHFSAQFKKHTNMTPSAYRKSVKISKIL